MTKQNRKRWVGVCLLGAALGATGCTVDITRAAPACCACGAGKPTTLAAAAQDQKVLPAVQSGTGPADDAPALITSVAAAPAPQPVKPTRAVSAVQLASAPEPAGASNQQLVIVSKPGRKKKRAASRPALAFEAAPARPAVPAPATLGQEVTADHGEAARRGYIDLTVQPWFGCAEDHSWLNGQLMHAQATDTWKLHYASVDDADPYGGTVTLVGQEKLTGLKDGGYVKVHGSLADPDRHEPGSPYRVDSVEAVERPK